MEKRRKFIQSGPKIIALTIVACLVFLPGWFSGEMPIVGKRAEGKWEFNLIKVNLLEQNRLQGEYQFAIYPLVPFHPVKAQLKEGKFIPPWGKGSSGRIHWLGTDHLGRDVLSGLIWGTRTSLSVGFIAVGVALLIGIILGAVVGYHRVYPLILQKLEISIVLLAMGIPTFLLLGGLGGIWLYVLVLSIMGFYVYILFIRTLRKNGHRVNIEGLTLAWLNVFDSLPGLIIAIVFFMLYPKMNYLSLGILLGILKMPVFFRIISGEIRHWVERPFVMSILLEQERWGSIFINELWPNIKHLVYLHSIYTLASVLITESTLSFLSLGGMTSDYVSWGKQLSLSRNYIGEWWLAVFPGLCIFFVILYLRNNAKEWENRSNYEF